MIMINRSKKSKNCLVLKLARLKISFFYLKKRIISFIFNEILISEQCKLFEKFVYDLNKYRPC